MANKRMFSNTIVRSDAFLTMPTSSRLLYYDLSMDADDDGFVDKPQSIIRMTGASPDDLKLLITKAFVIPFESGIIVIKHWRINNYLRPDRYKPTNYIEEKNQLLIKKNGAYTLKKDEDNEVGIPSGIPLVDADKYSIDKYSIDKINNSNSDIDNINKNNINNNISILLKDNEEYYINNILINEFINTYTNINIISELQKIKTWCLANPTKRKTRRGALRFINAWLNRANQNVSKGVKNEKVKYECDIDFPDFK